MRKSQGTAARPEGVLSRAGLAAQKTARGYQRGLGRVLGVQECRVGGKKKRIHKGSPPKTNKEGMCSGTGGA